MVAFVTVFKKEWAPFTTPLYAALEGLLLGGISQMYEKQFEGIVPLAVGLTMGTLGALLLAYTSRLIKVTENFRLGVFAATGAIGLLLPRLVRARLLRHPHPAHPRVRASSASASAWWW